MRTTKGKLVITEYAGSMLSLLMDKDNKIQNISCESAEKESIVGNIYIGRVTRIMDNLDAAFIEFANGSPGYLPMDGARKPIFISQKRAKGKLRVGDRLVMQVSRDSTKNKWPVMSCDIELVGKNLIFFPTKGGISFSKKFTDSERKKQVRAKLENSPIKDSGCIVRTNAESATLKSISREAGQLKQIWEGILEESRKRRGTPCIYHAQSVYVADIRDTYGKDIKEIVTDNKLAYDKINTYLKEFQPEDVEKLRLYDNKRTSLDIVYGVTRQVEEALSTRVWLKSGGYLVIEHTEALTSIDVNSGKSVSGKSPQKEYLKTNLEAASEVARQIRLRNLSGIIIVDFINMKAPADNEELMNILGQKLSEDPLRPDLVDMTPLGLVEITRKKGRRPLYELLNI